MIKVSLFASAVRPKLWPVLFKSLERTSVEYEVVFAGNITDYVIKPPIGHKTLMIVPNNINKFFHIKTENIKPAQCYEIARRNCTAEVVVWIADDCEFPNNVIGKAYDYWKSQNNEKLILSIQTKESGYGLPNGQLFDMNMHRFFGYRTETPLMAPLGMMSRKFLNDLGGIDSRYTAGQYENDLVMRAIVEGAKVELFGNKDCYIDIDHLGKSLLIGESKNEADFLNRPFAQGYNKDREILEASWTNGHGKMLMEMITPGNKVYKRNDKFEPFEDTDILIKSQSNKGIWQ